MIALLESMGGMTTPSKRFIDVPFYNDCSRCDPEQDMISSDCTAMPMVEEVAEVGAFVELPEELTQLVKLLNSIPFTPEQRQSVRLEQLNAQENKWPKNEWKNAPFPFMMLSDLRNLQINLMLSENGIQGLLSSQNLPRKPSSENLAAALIQARKHEQILQRLIPPVYADAISGKNCRVTQMLVQ